jgi:hypothetical protein
MIKIFMDLETVLPFTTTIHGGIATVGLEIILLVLADTKMRLIGTVQEEIIITSEQYI